MGAVDIFIDVGMRVRTPRNRDPPRKDELRLDMGTETPDYESAVSFGGSPDGARGSESILRPEWVICWSILTV